MPGVRIVVLPSPLASRPVADVQQMAHDFAPEIVGLLTDGRGQASQGRGPSDNGGLTLAELAGSIPDLTGDLTTEEFLRKSRGALAPE